MHNGCDIANQMFLNGQLWTWPLIFEICWTRLLSLVVYIYGHICDFLSRYAQLKQYILLQSEQPGDWHQMKTTGPQEQDDWNVWNTVNWWILTGRDDVTKRQELQILLKEGGGGGGGGFKLILAINTLNIFCEIPIRWIQHLTGH